MIQHVIDHSIDHSIDSDEFEEDILVAVEEILKERMSN